MTEKKSMLCPNCRKLISSDEPTCPYCGMVRPGALWKRGVLGGLSLLRVDPVKSIIVVNAAFYLFSLLLNPASLGLSANPMTFLSPSGESLFLLGATGTLPIAAYGRWWTLVSASFLHGGILHLFFNMMALYFFGIYLERLVGERELLKLYFTGGVGGGLLYVASSLVLGMPNKTSIAIGASGAIFAIAGALAVLQPNMKVVMIPIFIPMPLYIAVFIFMVLLSFMPGVAWQGHLGGLLVGVLFGLRLRKKLVEIVAVDSKYGYRFY